MSLLVVEDEVRIASFLVDGLRAQGHVVEHVTTGREALERAPASELVVLDLGLPDLDGFEVLRRLREQDSWVPVIVVTARTNPLDRKKGLELGADDYVTKPFSFDDLARRILTHLRNRRAS